MTVTAADFNKLEEIFAYDKGATDSGVRDEAERARIVAAIDATADDALRLILSQWIAERFLSDDAHAYGYGWEDALEFLQWFDSGEYRAGR